MNLEIIIPSDEPVRLLSAVTEELDYTIENEAEFIRKVRAASQVQKEDHAKALKRKIPEKRFEMLSSKYEQEQTALEESIAAEQSELEQFAEDSDRVEQFLALAKKYRDFTELTTPMIHEFVEKILVHAPEKIDGERSMQVDIYLRFIGNFRVPIPEPTPEDLARQEAERKRQAANRRKYQRRKEKLRQAEQQRSQEEQTI